MTKAQILALINAKILTGGRRTLAAGLREVLAEINESFLNEQDAGLVLDALVGYSSVLLTPTDDRHFTPKKYVHDLIYAISIPTISDTAYDPTSWNTNLEGATKNALRDKFVSIDAAIAAITTYTLDNGLDEISPGVAGLGGALSQNTTIDLGAFDFAFLNGADTVMTLLDNGRIAFGRSSAIDADTYFSIKNDGAFYPFRITDASNVDLMRVQNNAQVYFGGGIQDGSGNVSFSPASRQVLQSTGQIIWDYAAAMFYRNDGSDLFNTNLGIFYGSEEQFSIRVDNRKKYNSSSVEVEDWETQTMKNGDWFMATGNFVLSDSTKAFYLGPVATNGSWRIVQSGTDLSFERRESGTYVQKGTFTA